MNAILSENNSSFITDKMSALEKDKILLSIKINKVKELNEQQYVNADKTTDTNDSNTNNVKYPNPQDVDGGMNGGGGPRV